MSQLVTRLMSIPPSVKRWLKIGISVALLMFLFKSTGIEKTFQELSRANLWIIPLCVLIFLAGQFLSAYRWQLLSRPLGFQLSLREYYDYYLIGMYMNLFLPSAIGGDVGRVYYLAKGGNRKKREALLTIMADRGTGLVSLLILTSIVCLMPVAHEVPWSVRGSIIGLFLAGVVSFFALQILPIRQLAEKYPKLAILAQAEIYWKNIPLLLQTVLVSTCFHGLMVLVHVLIANALSVSVEPLYLLMVYGVVSLVSVLPVTFNGIGLREGAYQFLLVKYGLVDHIALAFGLYWFVISTITSLLGSIVLMRGHYKTPPTGEIEAELEAEAA